MINHSMPQQFIVDCGYPPFHQPLDGSPIVLLRRSLLSMVLSGFSKLPEAQERGAATWTWVSPQVDILLKPGPSQPWCVCLDSQYGKSFID